MATIANLLSSVPGVRTDWKADWKEGLRPDYKIDWDPTPGGLPPLPAPVNTVSPTISGSPTADSVLTASVGTWSGLSIVYSQQWLRNGQDISGATAATHTVSIEDLGTRLSVRVTATNASGTVSAVSSAVSIPAP
jgi:hypothetical protein